MKPIRLLAVTAVFAAVSLTSFASSPNFGPVNFKLSSIVQNPGFTTTLSTNKNSNSTNTTITYISTTTTTIINNKELMEMLSNSFNTTWPRGAVLKLGGDGRFYALDGTTVLQDVSGVLSLGEITTNVLAAAAAHKTTINTNGTSYSLGGKFIETGSANLVYDDSAFTTGNGKTTRFTLNGIEIARGSYSQPIAAVISFNGTGSGSISNSVSDNPLMVSGTFTAVQPSP